MRPSVTKPFALTLNNLMRRGVPLVPASRSSERYPNAISRLDAVFKQDCSGGGSFIGTWKGVAMWEKFGN